MAANCARFEKNVDSTVLFKGITLKLKKTKIAENWPLPRPFFLLLVCTSLPTLIIILTLLPVFTLGMLKIPVHFTLL